MIATDNASASPSSRGPFAALLDELNEGKDPHARVHHEATIRFGPSMLVERFVLGNGLKILTLADDRAPVICLQTWLGVGSRHEHEGKTGLAHLFEHLMFGETENLPHGSFDKLLEEAGADTNAATFLDWTYYHTNLPKEALPLAIRLESERLARLVLKAPQVSSEKEVVANERRQRVDDDVDGSVSELLYKSAFSTHAYRTPTIGWMEDIQAFTTEDCESFYKTYYAPNNTTLAVTGDVDLRVLLPAIQSGYGPMAPSRIPVEDVRPEPPQTAERRVSTKKPTSMQKVAIGYRGPALGDFDHPPLVLLNEILFGGRSSRVHKALVQKQEIATDVRGWVGSFRDPGLYDIFLGARAPHTTDELMAAWDAIVADAVANAPTDAEVARAKARLELGTLQGLETVSGKAEQLGFYETVLGDPSALFQRLEAFRRVTAGDLLRVARRYLVPSARTVVEVFPDESAAPSEGEDDEAA